MNVHPQEARISDFGHLLESSDGYLMSTPTSLAEAREIVGRAIANSVPIRMRGRGHSTHGGSLPKHSELLLKTENLRHFAFTEPGTITVGAGVSMHGLHLYLQERGFELPVYNDGGFGPSLGGYISASGFGIKSAVHGGFWENVDRVEFIDGYGREIVLVRENPDFQWIFGSMGQLGFIHSARLRILPLSDASDYPMGEVGEVPLYGAEQWGHEMDRPVFWLTIFAPHQDELKVKEKLIQLLERTDVLDYKPEGGSIDDLGAYTYTIKFKEFTPPLLSPHQNDLVAHGMWGFLKKSATKAEFYAFEREFGDLVKSMSGWTRYVQSEALPPGFDFREYWGDDIFEQFLRLKRKYDPSSLFNRGLVFAPEEVQVDG